MQPLQRQPIDVLLHLYSQPLVAPGVRQRRQHRPACIRRLPVCLAWGHPVLRDHAGDRPWDRTTQDGARLL